MEYVHGTNLASLSPVARLEADKKGLLDELFRAYLHQALIDGMVHADPHPGNVFLTPDNRLALIPIRGARAATVRCPRSAWGSKGARALRAA